MRIISRSGSLVLWAINLLFAEGKAGPFVHLQGG